MNSKIDFRRNDRGQLMSLRLVNTKGEYISILPCKGNKVPAHYLSAKKTTIAINGVSCPVYSNPERTIYTVVNVQGNWFYTTNARNIQGSKKYTVAEAGAAKAAPKAASKAAPKKQPKAASKQQPKAASEQRAADENTEASAAKTKPIIVHKAAKAEPAPVPTVRYSKPCTGGKHSQCNGVTSAMTQCVCSCHAAKQIGKPAPVANA